MSSRHTRRKASVKKQFDKLCNLAQAERARQVNQIVRDNLSKPIRRTEMSEGVKSPNAKAIVVWDIPNGTDKQVGKRLDKTDKILSGGHGYFAKASAASMATYA